MGAMLAFRGGRCVRLLCGSAQSVMTLACRHAVFFGDSGAPGLYCQRQPIPGGAVGHAGLEGLLHEIDTRRGQQTAARRQWCGGAEPIPAEPPKWPKGSLGERLCLSTHVAQTRNAPSLLTARVPDAAVIAADPAQWNVAARALIRAVVFDGVPVDHPVVSMLADVLAPVAEAELAYGQAMEAWLDRRLFDEQEGEPEFPEQDGPVFLLGGCAMVDATWAVVGEDPLSDVLPVLRPALAGAVPGLEGQVVADALIGALATHYQLQMPGDAEVLERIAREVGGNGLANLVAAGAVPPRDIVRVGLMVLSVLTELCRSDSASVLRQAA
jgi:hypothetical protein